METVDISFIADAGYDKRVLVRAGNTYHAGCFMGSKAALITAVKGKYQNDIQALNEYLEKIETLSKTTYLDYQDIHAEDNEVLRWAADNDHLEVVKFLIQAGADVHARDNYALRCAARNGHLEIVKVLIAAGADVHAGDNQALRWAAHNDHLGVVKVLIAAGADVHARDNQALIWAAREGHLEIVKFLIQAGADTKVALKCAEKGNYRKAIRTLESVIKESHPSKTKRINL